MAFKLHSFADDAGLAKEAAASWLRVLGAQKKSIHESGAYCVALSGGRIARNFFSEIARQGVGHRELFNQVHFFWADERCVPPTDPESNYAIAKGLLFDPLKVPDAQVHRLRGEENEALALRDALENISKWGSPKMGKGSPIFDMIFLGMGEDGHVASLFPGESDEVMSNSAFYRAVTAVKPPPRRFTLGYDAIIAALEVWVLAAGAGKQGALKVSLSPTGKTPLARVLRQRIETEIFTDVVP
jgi:6-phosphogluconolactonase